MFSIIRRIRKKLFKEILIRKVSPYTMCNAEKIRSLIRLSEHINSRGIEGDFVECGVYKGGAAAVLAKYRGKDRHLWLYDSFEGLPKSSERDGEEAKKWVGKCVGTVKDAKEAMKIVSTGEECYTIKKGWFEQTFREKIPSKVALLHCDADWYSSVLLVLDTFYPLISEGGCVVLDDFGYWEGCREAFYDFCFKHGEKPLLERVGADQAYWIKGKANNRDL